MKDITLQVKISGRVDDKGTQHKVAKLIMTASPASTKKLKFTNASSLESLFLTEHRMASTFLLDALPTQKNARVLTRHTINDQGY